MNVEKIIKTETEIPLIPRTLIHLTLVNAKITEIFASALKPHDISIQQFNVLRILRGQKGKPSNLSTLNERMVTKMSNTTRLVDKLLSKGYVDRIVCPSNRRKVEINITKDGLKALKFMDAEMEKANDFIVQDLTEQDLKQLNNLLNKF
ncbi:MarR family transcriptional regulator [Aurantibacter crassamenti]|uniref:MarR family winged helix-turn-helix transcriptional regulator n=1 Tax=Aurantibacter crassamenti TaxID=1837375 RepID=UPI001939B9C8|nr:MarR family transcriptional regulator [Aurantibacter crassamenti]MBM1107988.1 MarR family transcriptional regulator [Aurantibacter crassamenti]